MTVAVRDQCQIPCPLDGRGQLALISGLGARYPAGYDLASFRDVRFEGINVLVIDFFNTLCGKFAVSTASEVT